MRFADMMAFIGPKRLTLTPSVGVKWPTMANYGYSRCKLQ